MVNHERQAGIGPLAGWRGNGEVLSKGKVNPNQINEYIKTDVFINMNFKKSKLLQIC